MRELPSAILIVVGLLPPMPGASGRGSDGGNDSGGRAAVRLPVYPPVAIAGIRACELPHLREHLPQLASGICGGTP